MEKALTTRHQLLSNNPLFKRNPQLMNAALCYSLKHELPFDFIDDLCQIRSSTRDVIDDKVLQDIHKSMHYQPSD